MPAPRANALSIRRSAATVLFAAILVTTLCAPLPARQAAAEKTLYARIGGFDTIAGVVDAWIDQIKKDKAFDRFGGGRSTDSLKRARQLIVNQICNLSGGPCIYIGRPTKTAHAGLQITKEEWETSNRYFNVALAKYKVSGKDKDDFMQMIEKLREDIVEGKTAKQ